MARSTRTKPFVILGPKGREFKTSGGLLRACARACGNQSPRFDTTRFVIAVDWPAGQAEYKYWELDDRFEIEEQLGYDL
jgi:hypothetical protein